MDRSIISERSRQTAREPGGHTATIQIVIEKNAYPPVIHHWDFSVYNDPPEITLVINDESSKKLIAMFDRPVPDYELEDPSRWGINSSYFALSAKAVPGKAAVILTAHSNIADYKLLTEPTFLEFNNVNGQAKYQLFRAVEKPGSRSGQDECTCAPIGPNDFDPQPGGALLDNPHDFDENELNAWAYRFEVLPGYCEFIAPTLVSYRTVRQTYARWTR